MLQKIELYTFLALTILHIHVADCVFLAFFRVCECVLCTNISVVYLLASPAKALESKIYMLLALKILYFLLIFPLIPKSHSYFIFIKRSLKTFSPLFVSSIYIYIYIWVNIGVVIFYYYNITCVDFYYIFRDIYIYIYMLKKSPIWDTNLKFFIINLR